ncbi:MAG: GAF domain-containing protein [Alphaproteobacteria bacterium]|nr:GAF domain-containing protein [Alphaproteobacteria bacterium]
MATFEHALAAAKGEAAWDALMPLCQRVVGAKLFTVMTVDNALGLARRAYTNDASAYPVSGTKPIHRDRWFDTVHGQQRSFVANTLADIATVFPDHELIGKLGCGSVINLPVVVDGAVVATINMLDVEHHYTPARVALAEKWLRAPARQAYLAALAGGAA